MALVEVNYNPNPKELRLFGTIAMIATTIISLLLHLTKGLILKWCLVIIAVGLVIFILSRISLSVTKGIYISFTLLTLPVGIVVSYVLLGVFFYLILAPIGLFFRLIGRDILYRKFESNNNSYWVKRKRQEDLKHYFRQF